MRIIALLTAIAWIASAQAPLKRALRYLSAEVPEWRVKNGCFSCHNNGDGARALYAAGQLEPLRTTTEWLQTPAEWTARKSDPGYSDTTLALYQFAAALTSAVKARAIQDRHVLTHVALKLVSIQQPDGSWRVEDIGEAAGSPVTWGTTLATYFGCRTLREAGNAPEALRRAEMWLRSAQPRHTPDVAAILLAFPEDASVRKQAVERFTRMQTRDGGWGPNLHAPAEVFDTAIVLLALQSTGEHAMIARGREFLIRTQQSSGGWPETTRPSGSQSYAQHISTTAWATMALLATDSERK